MASKRQSLGIAWVSDPEAESGILYTKGEDGKGREAPRPIGEYAVRTRYILMGVPMMSVDVTFDSGHEGYGKLRADAPGYVDVYPRKGKRRERVAQSVG